MQFKKFDVSIQPIKGEIAMNNKSLLNQLVNHVVYTIDNIMEKKNIPQELTNYLYLITAGMILNYKDYPLHSIYNIIQETTYNINKQYNNNLYYYNPTNHNYLSKTLDLTSSFPTININYEIIFKSIENSPIKTLEYLTYELNYILHAKQRKIPIKNNLKLRFDFLTSHQLSANIEQTKIIDKIFYILQTEDIIKKILKLCNSNITNKKFKNALNNLDKINKTNYKIEGLDILVNLIRPLYNFEDTKKIINSFNNKLIENELEKVLGNNAYKIICQKLELLNELVSHSNDYYAISNDYIFIRNNYINKYITFKQQMVS